MTIPNISIFIASDANSISIIQLSPDSYEKNEDE